MLDRLIAYSLRNRPLILCLALVVAVWGGVTAAAMPVDVLPDLNRPTVTVMTEAHSLVPEDVERLITRPIERGLNGATGVSRIRSASGPGLSVVIVEFEWGSDVYRNRQIVQEKLQLIRDRLPEEAVPSMAPISSIMGQVRIIGLASPEGQVDPVELRALAENEIRYRLLSVPGVAKIIVSGGAPRQLQVVIDVERLNAHGVTLQEVEAAVRKANGNHAGGILDIGSQGPMVTVTGRILESRQLEQAVVRGEGVRPILIRDVARVTFGPAAVQIGDAGVEGRPGVLLVVFKQPDVDTVALDRGVDRELEQIKAVLPEGVRFVPDIFRQADFIDRAVTNVLDAVRDGALLVTLVLIIFMANWRTTLITLTALPLSVAVTALVFAIFDLTINTMTLGGLAVAIGALVDDAIVDVENVLRRLRESRGSGKNPLTVVYTASREVRRPILIGTLLVIVVYLPLFFLSGLEGRLFTPIGLAYITSVAASLLVALTVTPTLAYLLLGRRTDTDHDEEPRVVTRLKKFAAVTIRRGMDNAGSVAAGLGLASAAALVVLLSTGTQFLPAFNEGVIQVGMTLPPETGLSTSNAFGRRLEQGLAGIKGIRSLGRQTGRAEGNEHAHGVNTTEIIATLDPESGRSRAEVLADVRRLFQEEFPGVSTSVDQPLSHLLSHMLSGVKAQVAIKISGPDLTVLRQLAGEVEGRLKVLEGAGGVVDLYREPQVLVSMVRVDPDREALARCGLTVEDLGEAVELALEGETVSEMAVGAYTYPIILRLEPEDRGSLERIRALRLPLPDGRLVPLGEVARVALARTPNNINHENATRQVVVQHNVAGRALGDVVGDVDAALETVRATLPTGYALRISGQFEAQQEAQTRIFWLSWVSLLVMGAVLWFHFQSVNLSLQVLASLPMGLIGAVAAISITGQQISIATLVGIIALGGIAARNGILLVDHALTLIGEAGQVSQDVLVRAGQERLVPVVMTALTSGIALVPIAMSPGEPGRELLYPVATVIIGGLISSTLMDFFARPALLWLWGRKALENRARELHTLESKEDLT